MKSAVIYVHGKGGTIQEAEHYKQLFPNRDVIGFDYHAPTPWDAIREYREYFDNIKSKYDSVVLIANSIGAYYSVCATVDNAIDKAYFISPIVNMERLIGDMMKWANVTETELRQKGVVDTAFGEKLSWEYLSWVRSHKVSWHCPTAILYGSQDNMQSISTVKAFADEVGATVTVIQGGEHWLHTAEQMAIVDKWIKNNT